MLFFVISLLRLLQRLWRLAAIGSNGRGIIPTSCYCYCFLLYSSHQLCTYVHAKHTTQLHQIAYFDQCSPLLFTSAADTSECLIKMPMLSLVILPPPFLALLALCCLGQTELMLAFLDCCMASLNLDFVKEREYKIWPFIYEIIAGYCSFHAL